MDCEIYRNLNISWIIFKYTKTKYFVSDLQSNPVLKLLLKNLKLVIKIFLYFTWLNGCFKCVYCNSQRIVTLRLMFDVESMTNYLYFKIVIVNKTIH